MMNKTILSKKSCLKMMGMKHLSISIARHHSSSFLIDLFVPFGACPTLGGSSQKGTRKHNNSIQNILLIHE
jgi:hypothetical protein